eukprot:TRINITY_DN1046_c0_g5_i1.p1 TRINITY_DN1046_c0_g5~~TRINITY_DN1046_c0_g5_i1.p1  ORF type:complete len:552 (-),score=106.14 TRINITY_DN1046_c0_g5_i1:235-1851(-)
MAAPRSGPVSGAVSAQALPSKLANEPIKGPAARQNGATDLFSPSEDGLSQSFSTFSQDSSLSSLDSTPRSKPFARPFPPSQPPPQPSAQKQKSLGRIVSGRELWPEGSPTLPEWDSRGFVKAKRPVASAASSFRLPPVPALPVIDMSMSDLIGTVDVRGSATLGRGAPLSGSATGGAAERVLSFDAEEFLYSAKKPNYSWEIDPRKLTLKNFIASGTYGTVHRGVYDGKDVAVKLLDWGEDSDDSRAKLSEVREAFVREVSVWSELSHRNVTQFIGAIRGGSQGFQIPSTVTGHNGKVLVAGHVSCVVLEYLPGGCLKHVLDAHQQKKLPYKVVLQYALDIARGLAYLHSKHIVHRDVKSENMLLDRHQVVKIADFGVSRVENRSKRFRGIAGTYGYMAPEILEGKLYDNKVDVYSFGILLWETYCCANPFPFNNFNVRDIHSFVSQGLRPEIPPCCPPDLATLIRRCWHKDPLQRPGMDEVEALLQALDPAKGNKMTESPLNVAMEKMRRGGLKHNHHHGPSPTSLFSRMVGKLQRK